MHVRIIPLMVSTILEWLNRYMSRDPGYVTCNICTKEGISKELLVTNTIIWVCRTHFDWVCKFKYSQDSLKASIMSSWFDDAATLPDWKKLASAEHVVFNQIHAWILAGVMSDRTEEHLILQTWQSLANMQLRGTLGISLCCDRNTLGTVQPKRLVSA